MGSFRALVISTVAVSLNPRAGLRTLWSTAKLSLSAGRVNSLEHSQGRLFRGKCLHSSADQRQLEEVLDAFRALGVVVAPVEDDPGMSGEFPADILPIQAVCGAALGPMLPKEVTVPIVALPVPGEIVGPVHHGTGRFRRRTG